MCKCASTLYISIEKYLAKACPYRDEYLTSFRVNVFNKLVLIFRHAQRIFAVTKKLRFGLTNLDFQ